MSRYIVSWVLASCAGVQERAVSGAGALAQARAEELARDLAAIPDVTTVTIECHA